MKGPRDRLLMMTESIDQSFKQVPRDQKGIYGGRSPLPHEKKKRQEMQLVDTNISDLKSDTQNSIERKAIDMESKQLIKKTPVKIIMENGRRIDNDSINKSTERGPRVNNASINSKESGFGREDYDSTPK